MLDEVSEGLETGATTFARTKKRALKPALFGSKPDSLAYTSCRLKSSSFSRHPHLEHSRQQTISTATPAATRTASTVAFNSSHASKLCISPMQTRNLQECRAVRTPFNSRSVVGSKAIASAIQQTGYKCILLQNANSCRKVLAKWRRKSETNVSNGTDWPKPGRIDPAVARMQPLSDPV